MIVLRFLLWPLFLFISTTSLIVGGVYVLETEKHPLFQKLNSIMRIVEKQKSELLERDSFQEYLDKDATAYSHMKKRGILDPQNRITFGTFIERLAYKKGSPRIEYSLSPETKTYLESKQSWKITTPGQFLLKRKYDWEIYIFLHRFLLNAPGLIKPQSLTISRKAGHNSRIEAEFHFFWISYGDAK